PPGLLVATGPPGRASPVVLQLSRSGDRHAHPARRRTCAGRGLRQRRVNLDVAAQQRPEVVGQRGRPGRLHEWPRAADRLGEVARGLAGGGREDVDLVDVVRSRLTVIRRLEAERHGSGPVLDVSGIRAEIRDAGDADVVRWRARMLRARAERSHAPAEAAAHQAVEDARMQAAAVLLELVLPFALHGGALRIEVVEAAEAPAGRADLAGELRQHAGFGHDGGIDPASGDRTAAGDATARRLTDAAAVGRGADLVIRAGAVAGGRAVRARSLTDAARGGGHARLPGGTAAAAGGRRGARARELTDAARGGGDARLSGGTGAATGGRRGARARQLADAARGGRDARLSGGTGAATGGRRGARAGQLADTARGGGNAGLSGGTGAVARGRRSARARELADAARGGRNARLPGRTAAVTRRRRSARARELADTARGSRDARLSGGAGAATGGRRGARARDLADTARGGRDAGLAGGTGAGTGGRRGARARDVEGAARGRG